MDESYRSNPDESDENERVVLIDEDALADDDIVRPGRSVFDDVEDDLLDDDISLPHWTEPPTGTVRAVGGDLDAWATISGSQPRWRESAADFDDEPEFRFEPQAAEEHDFFSYEGDEDDDGFSDDDFDVVAVAPGAAGSEARGPAPATEVVRRRSRSRADEMGLRIGTGVALAAVALVAFVSGPRVTVVLVAIVLGLAVAELFGATRRAGYQPAVLLGIVASVAMPLAVYWRGVEAIPLVLFLAVVFTMLWFLVGAGTESPLLNTGVTLLGVLYVGLLGSFAALMLYRWGDDGIGVLLGAVIATVAYDVGGLIVGRTAGKSPLSASSPNKTVEGLFGGMALAVIATTVVVSQIHPWGTVGHAFLLGLAVAIVAPLGDLCESMLKRDLGVKDMGSILPGHGGVLDRFDALLFTLPVAYEVARWLDLGQPAG